MSNIENRYELLFFIEAKNCNYNGDPDFDNLPRIDFETNKGYMTDVAIKRKIRDYIKEAYNGESGCEIFVQNGHNLNKGIAECVIEASNGGKVEKGKKSIEAGEIAKKRFWDVRTFGGVLSTGLNAGQIQGAVQFNMPISYDEVETNQISITRLAYTEKEFTELGKYDEYDKTLDDSSKRTIGKKTFSPYALFECRAFVSGNLAQKNGFSEKDLDMLLEAILNMYSFQTSASKAGMSVVGPVIIFKHIGNSDESNVEQRKREALLGCCHAQKLFGTVSVKKNDTVKFPRNYTDYSASIDMSKIPSSVNVGFKWEPFSKIEWNELREDEWFKKL